MGEATRNSGRDIFSLPLKRLKLYQLYDNDGDQIGIVATTANSDVVDDLSGKFTEAVNNDENADLSADGFAAFITENGYTAERIFIEDDVNLKF